MGEVGAAGGEEEGGAGVGAGMAGGGGAAAGEAVGAAGDEGRPRRRSRQHYFGSKYSKLRGAVYDKSDKIRPAPKLWAERAA